MHSRLGGSLRARKSLRSDASGTAVWFLEIYLGPDRNHARRVDRAMTGVIMPLDHAGRCRPMVFRLHTLTNNVWLTLGFSHSPAQKTRWVEKKRASQLAPVERFLGIVLGIQPKNGLQKNCNPLI